MQVMAMKCPGCGAGLAVAPQLEHFNCGYCGTSVKVVRAGGTVSLVIESLSKIQLGTDRTAAELALVRLKSELAEFNANNSRPPPPYPWQASTFRPPPRWDNYQGAAIVSLIGLVSRGVHDWHDNAIFASFLIFGSPLLLVPYLLFREKGYRKELAQALKDHQELDSRKFATYLAVTNEMRKAEAAFAERRGIIEKKIRENQSIVSR